MPRTTQKLWIRDQRQRVSQHPNYFRVAETIGDRDQCGIDFNRDRLRILFVGRTKRLRAIEQAP